MTGTEFRQGHGDPATWDDDAYELYADCATPGGKPVPDDVLAFLKQPPPPKSIDAAPADDPGLEKHFAEASLITPPHNTQTTA